MKTPRHLKTAALVAVLVAAPFGAGGAFAANGMGKGDYAAAKDRIDADFKVDKTACDKFSGNTKDICIEEAKGKEKVARAELEARYTGTANDQAKVPVARADAAYEVAKEKCDDKGGNAKDVCVQEAKADRAKALADAKSGKS